MIMMKLCDVCLTEFLAQRRSARYCGDRCRKRAQRAGMAGPRKIRVVPAPSDGPSALELAVEAELAAAGQQSSALGAMARHLAQHLVDPYATGAAVANLSKELREVMAKVRQGAQPATGALAELRAARERRDRKRMFN